MHFNRSLIYGAAAAAVAAFSAANRTAHAQPPAEKPNVIIIFTDDMGYSDISSFATNPFPVRTTNIDQIAAEGMKFTHFYVAMPICSPSRAAMLSGRFAPESGLTNYLQFRNENNTSDQNDYMDPSHSHLPKTFQAGGYYTAHVGKWHLGGGRDVDNAPSISEYGYNEAYSTWESPNPDPQLGIKFQPWNMNTEFGQVPRHKRTEYMVDRTMDILLRKRVTSGTPCFITLWPDDLHTPFWPSPEMAAKHGGVVDDVNTRADFYGVLEEYDRQIGRLMDRLEEEGLEDNTIILFTGDNGPSPDFGRDRTNGMNGSKLSLYEGGIRQPFIIKWPGHVPAGTTNDRTIMSTVDFLPTLSALAGINMLPEAAAVTDGEDLSAAVLGNTQLSRSEPLMWEYGRTTQVPRPGVNDVDRSPILAIREGDFKLLVNPNNTGHELYNVRTDPGESSNLAAAYPSVVQSMSAEVLAWRATLPHRTQPFPVFSTVNFNQFSVAPFISSAALQAGAGRTATSRIDGVAAAPNGTDDLFAIHVDEAGRKSFLRIDDDTASASLITNTEQMVLELNAPTGHGIDLMSGFDYSPAGDRLFVMDDGFGSTNPNPAMLAIGAGSGLTSVIRRGSELSGMSDHTTLPDGTIAGVRGAGGNRSIGTLGQGNGVWTQRYSETQLKAAASGSTQIIPETIGADSSSGEVHVASHQDRRIFRITDVIGGTAASALAQAALADVDLHDLVADQAGNMYGYDATGQKIVVVRRTDGAVFQVLLTEISSRLGGVPFVPTAYRGLAARMSDPTHAELFLASSTPEHGIIRVRFGTIPAAVDGWSLY